MISLIHLIFETYHLKRISRAGSQMIGSNLGNIAEHSYIVSIIALLLSINEKTNTEKVLIMSLIHDLPETRIGDSNYINKRYQILFEDDAIHNQLHNLKLPIKKKLIDLFNEYRQQQTIESKIVKDADILEQLFNETIQLECGNVQARGWINFSLKRKLYSQSAKLIAKHLKNANSYEWWQQVLQQEAKEN